MKVGDYIYLNDTIGVVVGKIIDIQSPEIFYLQTIKMYDTNDKCWIDLEYEILINLSHPEVREFKIYEKYEEVIENHFEVFI